MPLSLPDTYQRLPVYIVIDTSGSMAGAPIVAVNEGLKMFEQIIRNDEQCRETTHASVIRFASDAQQMQPLAPAAQFAAPHLDAGGSTSLSEGLKTLRESIRREMKPKSADYPGDYKPLVFLMTDGEPNQGDPWKSESVELFKEKGRRPSMIVAIGVGPQANMTMLRELSAENAYLLADLDQTKLKDLFKWIGNSTIRASRPASQAVGAAPAQMLATAPPNLFESKP